MTGASRSTIRYYYEGDCPTCDRRVATSVDSRPEGRTVDIHIRCRDCGSITVGTEYDSRQVQ